MDQKRQLIQDIERYRNLLNEKSKTTSLISKEMLEYSHKLDQLLNEYDYLVSRNKWHKEKTNI
ncbi:aspartyl-phosphate phosphatase Spo0E family protein [Halalkalibacter krulwichiae]|uniref:Spo0E like sporulation regulatory protein n=1 Tax=Halalkalibacter krulwichiae TaxID=199441 RepID=A0A1X9MAF7_9BACI|nr:aspartyl-phosphate phosphatase Spo0E family protein [Halalkalibacter krulwichiae]ARK28561.1 Spo0E like sporulation regulatory protein [Halalkalibacter krulwichiae]